MSVRELLQLAPGAIVELDRTGRRASRRAGQRCAHRARRGGRGQRQVRHTAHGCGERDRTHGARADDRDGARPYRPVSVSSMAQLDVEPGGRSSRLIFAPRLGDEASEDWRGLAAAATSRSSTNSPWGPANASCWCGWATAQVLLGVGASGIVSLTPLAVCRLPLEGLRRRHSPFAERLRDFMKRPGVAGMTHPSPMTRLVCGNGR